MNMFLSDINPTLAALYGAAIGGVFGVAGTIILAWSSSKSQNKSFERTVLQQKINDTKQAYQQILQVLFLLRMEGFINDNRKLHSEMVSKLSIFSSDAIKKTYLPLLRDGLTDDNKLTSLISLMETHIRELEADLLK